MQSTELVQSISITNLLNKRDSAINLLLEGLEKLSEASAVLNSCGLVTVRDLFNNDRYSNGVNVMDSNALDKVKRLIDASGWEMLMNETGFKSFMTAKRKDEWQESLKELKHPELTKENIASTFETIHGNRLNMLEEGVINVFRRLSWEYKTNCPKMFDKKVIITRLFDKFGYINSSTCNELDDLMRVLSLVDGKPEADHRRGMYTFIGDIQKQKGSTYENEFFELKFYVKAGTAHLKFKRLDVVEKMNKILAKHYPNAIPSDFGTEKKEDFTPFDVKEDIKPVQLSKEAMDAIKTAEVVSTNDNGYGLKLANQLPRHVYDEVNAALVEHGMVWSAAKKMHIIFSSVNIKYRLDRLSWPGTYYPAKNYGYFPTPLKLAEYLVDIAEVRPGDLVLEPSAGKGNIVDAIMDAQATVDAYEFLPQNVDELMKRKIKVEGVDFLKVSPTAIYDKIVMNPPFSKKQDMMHVMHAYRFLKPETGVLVAIVSAGVRTNSDSFSQRFRDFVKMNNGTWYEVEQGAFKESGTMVNTVIVKIQKTASTIQLK